MRPACAPSKTGVECEAFDPSYGDVFVVNARRYRIEKYSPTGELILMFGGEVDKTKVQKREEEEANPEPITVTAEEEDVCTVASGDACGEGVAGTGPSHFYNGGYPLEWGGGGTSRQNSIAVGPDGTVYVGDYGRIQEFNLRVAPLPDRPPATHQLERSRKSGSSSAPRRHQHPRPRRRNPHLSTTTETGVDNPPTRRYLRAQCCLGQYRRI